jgi:hypothetical protein
MYEAMQTGMTKSALNIHPQTTISKPKTIKLIFKTNICRLEHAMKNISLCVSTFVDLNMQ